MSVARPLARARATSLAAIAGPMLLASACVADGHPLGSNGSVEIVIMVDGPLYATDLLDADGNPVGPRQTPYQTDILLKISEDDEVGHGAYVQVHIEPAEALSVSTALDTEAEGAMHEDGSGPTCALVDGAFRCRGNDEGYARFSVTSFGDWQGEAKIFVDYADTSASAPIKINAAGLPTDATNLQMIGLGRGETIPPSYASVSCSIDEVPTDLGSKWPAGGIRSREVFVRATPPLGSPGIIANAPVIVESLTADGALSLSEACGDADRQTRIRLLLDEKGESSRFFTCFSDLGGEVAFGVTSGEKEIDSSLQPSATVSPEPRLIRIVVLSGQEELEQSSFPEQVFEVSAYDAALKSIPMDVDLTVEGSISGVLTLTEAAVTLNGGGPTIVSVAPEEVGTAKLVVRPQLLSNPKCESDTVTVFAP